MYRQINCQSDTFFSKKMKLDDLFPRLFYGNHFDKTHRKINEIKHRQIYEWKKRDIHRTMKRLNPLSGRNNELYHKSVACDSYVTDRVGWICSAWSGKCLKSVFKHLFITLWLKLSKTYLCKAFRVLNRFIVFVLLLLSSNCLFSGNRQKMSFCKFLTIKCPITEVRLPSLILQSEIQHCRYLNSGKLKQTTKFSSWHDVNYLQNQSNCWEV